MELCPKCKKMSAHRDITSKRLICYRVGCDYIEEPISDSKEKAKKEKIKGVS